MVTLGILGATGRMGKHIIAASLSSFRHRVGFGIVRNKAECDSLIPYHEQLDTLPPVDVLIDFSSPSLLPFTLELAGSTRTPLILGTTGLQETQITALQELSKIVPVAHSSNFSVGVSLLCHMLQTISSGLTEFTCHIEETHHSHKKDAPSGTALALQKSILQGNPNLIPSIESIRQGEVIGEHKISFTSPGEKISICHESLSRQVFVRGVFKAIDFIIQAKPGLYTMQDIVVEHISSNYIGCRNTSLT